MQATSKRTVSTLQSIQLCYFVIVLLLSSYSVSLCKPPLHIECYESDSMPNN